MYSNIGGYDNTAVGFQALFSNDSTGHGIGIANSAFGSHALSWGELTVDETGDTFTGAEPLRSITQPACYL